ncbi:MAG TPA: DUF1080 domain-containing protein [Cyclobacteriaceae bacterium]|nr:DUF1080 domain-containing protein [Cyclobacteriaceae bacterium]
MKNLLYIILIAFMASCSSNKTENVNTDGWEVLFDGSNLNSWRTFRNMPQNSWEIVEGTLHCKDFDQAQQRADLITLNQYENFELHFEWKIGHQGNSGVMYRVSEDLDQPYLSGPEYQLIDDENFPGELNEWQRSGADYAMHAAEGAEINPAGEWNVSKLIVNGHEVEHWLNGKPVVAYEIGSADWLERKANSKWADAEGYAAYAKGHICLQDHGQEVWFRNIKIKSL